MDAQLIANIALGIIILDKIARATPPDFKIWKLQIGKYDDAFVDLVKDIFSIISTKKAPDNIITTKKAPDNGK